MKNWISSILVNLHKLGQLFTNACVGIKIVHNNAVQVADDFMDITSPLKALSDAAVAPFGESCYLHLCGLFVSSLCLFYLFCSILLVFFIPVFSYLS